MASRTSKTERNRTAMNDGKKIREAFDMMESLALKYRKGSGDTTVPLSNGRAFHVHFDVEEISIHYGSPTDAEPVSDGPHFSETVR